MKKLIICGETHRYENLSELKSVLLENNINIDIDVEIGHGVELGKNVRIQPCATIYECVSIGDNTTIGVNSYIKSMVKIGKNTIIKGGVSIGNNSTIGDNLIIPNDTRIEPNSHLNESNVFYSEFGEFNVFGYGDKITIFGIEKTIIDWDYTILTNAFFTITTIAIAKKPNNVNYYAIQKQMLYEYKKAKEFLENVSKTTHTKIPLQTKKFSFIKELLSIFKRPVYIEHNGLVYDINQQIFTYKNKDYKIVKVVKGKLAPNTDWVDCILYQALYLEKDNQFVRSKEQFFHYFTPKNN